MTEAFYAVLKASFQGSIVILAVLLLRQLLKKAPKSVFCLLWLLAGLRLVLPFEIQSSLSLQPRLQEPELSIQMETPVQVPDFVVPAVEESEATPAPVNPGNAENKDYLYEVEDGVITDPVTIGDIVPYIWLLGMGAMLAASAWSYWKLKRRVRMAYLIENGCFECPGLETAFVLGFLPPRIYLPAGLTDGEKKFIFDHETTHIARGDHWFKLLGYLVLSLHWFNPLVWVGYGLLSRDIELACDEHVVKFMSLAERKAYSAALLSCGGHTARIAACPVAFGESNPKNRILNVLNYKRPGFWISLIGVIAVIFVAVCLLTSPNREEVPEEEVQWNLEMQVDDVTPSGLQVKFVQTGVFWGSDRASLQYGSYYTLEKWVEGAWEPVEMLPQEYEVAWTMEAYLIDLNSTKAFNLDWEWLYGQLPEGKYRIGKGVALHYTIGETEHRMFYAEFVIEQTQPAWNMEMTEEEYLAMCCNAVAEFQNRENYHVSEIIVHYTNDRETGREYASYWHYGDDWARQYYVPRTEETSTHLHYQGEYFLRLQKENDAPSWDLSGDADYGQYSEPWLSRLDWDAQIITFELAEQVGDLLHIFATVHAAPEFEGFEDVTQYTVGFFFDQTGNLHTAMMGSLNGDVHTMSDLRMQTTPDANIREKLDQIAAERFVALIE